MLDFLSSGAWSILGVGASALVPAIAARFLPRLIVGGSLGGPGLFVIALVLLALGGLGGWYITKKFWDASELAAVNAAIAQERGQTHLVLRVETEIQTKIERVRVVEKELIHAAPIIITREVEGACPDGLPNGFVRLHDAAAASTAPGAAAQSDKDPAGVTLAQANAKIRDNYTEYHVCREQVIGWNAFYSCLRKLSDRDDVAPCMTKLMQQLRASKAADSAR